MNSSIYITYPLYCPHCGRFNVGLRDSSDIIHYSCSDCGMKFQKSLSAPEFSKSSAISVKPLNLVKKAL